MRYTLYNKVIKRKLVHPVVGLWHTSDLSEAEEMLRLCREHVQGFVDSVPDNEEAKDLLEGIVIMDADTEEEI